MDISEADHHEEKQDLLVFIIVGKRGKMRRKERKLLCHPGCVLLITWVKSDIR